VKYQDADTVKIGKISQSLTYHANYRRSCAVQKKEEREIPGAVQKGIAAQPEYEDQH